MNIVQCGRWSGMHDMTDKQARHHFGAVLWSKMKETSILFGGCSKINTKGQFVYSGGDLDEALSMIEVGK